MISLAMLTKLCLVFFFKFDLKFVYLSQIWERAFERIKNTLERTFSDLWSLNLVFVCLRKKKHVFYFFRIFRENGTFQKVPCFTVKWMVWLILDLTEEFVLSMWWFPSKNIRQKSSGSVLMKCWRSPLCWSLIFCKTYKFLCNMWCVMCDAWCLMFQTWFFCKILTLWVKGRPETSHLSDFWTF